MEEIMFIKLTVRNGDEVYINANDITYMERYDGYTFISMTNHDLSVKERPEEIAKVIGCLHK